MGDFITTWINKFKNIIDFAVSIIQLYEKTPHKNMDSTKHPIFDVIRILGRKIQVQYLTHLISTEYESSLPNIDPDSFLFSQYEEINRAGLTLEKLKKPVETRKEVSLSKDLILPWPWRKDRLIYSIGWIGEGRKKGSWKQDDYNHDVELWLPIGISWVYGGNHSIISGVVQGTGKIIPDQVYDVSDIYDYVYCNGENYIRTEDNTIIAPVSDVWFAALFEIGRLIVNGKLKWMIFGKQKWIIF